MNFLATTSTRPRKTTTASAVTTSETARLAWSESYRTRKNAGLVSSATAVAARVSPRHSRASAGACSLIGPLGLGLCSA